MANEDPAAVIGADENSAVPVLTGEYADLSARKEREAVQVRENEINNANPNAMDDDDDDCTMIILDGIVMGPQVNRLNWPQYK